MKGKCDKVYKMCMKTCGMCDGGQCKDKINSEECVKLMEAGKCKNVKIAQMCMETCDKCGGKCKNKMPPKKCKKIMDAGKCEDEKIAKKCLKTCDMCVEEPKQSNQFSLI